MEDTQTKTVEIEWSEEKPIAFGYVSDLIVNGKKFELKGEAFPETDQFGDHYIVENYQAVCGCECHLKVAWEVIDIDSYNEGNFDCFGPDDFDRVTITDMYGYHDTDSKFNVTIGCDCNNHTDES